MVACRRIESGLFKRAFLQTLLIKEEAVRVPTQKIHALPVPGEEHEDVPCHRGQGGIRSGSDLTARRCPSAY